LTEQLPENFPQALPIIQNEIAPITAECDPGLKDHYISLIKCLEGRLPSGGEGFFELKNKGRVKTYL